MVIVHPVVWSSHDQTPDSQGVYKFPIKELWGKNVVGYIIRYFNFTNGSYTITAGKNDKIDVWFNSQEYTLTLSPGVYYGKTLATETETQLNASVAAGFTTSYSTETRKFTSTHTDTAFSFLFGTGTNKNKSAAHVIGFNESDTSSSTSVTSPNLAEFGSYRDRNIIIKCPELAIGCHIRNELRTDIMDILPNAALTGEQKVYHDLSGPPLFYENGTTRNVSYANVSIHYADSELPVENNGASWTIKLHLYVC